MKIAIRIFSITYSTRLKTVETYVRGYSDTETCYYQLLCKNFYVCGIRLFWKSYFEEKVPSWAIQQFRTLGSTDWKSTRPDLITLHNQRVKTTKNKNLCFGKV